MSTQGFANASVAVRNPAGTVTYGVLTTGGTGHYSGQVTIPSSPLSARVTATIDPADPHAARYASAATNVTLTAGQTTNVAQLNLPAASGFHCILGGITYPLKDVLHLTDTLNGSFNLNWTSANIWQTSGLTLTSTACSSPICPSVAAVPCQYTFQGAVSGYTLTFVFRTSNFVACPDPAGGRQTIVTTPVTPTVDPFNVSQAVPVDNAWYCNIAQTWTLTE